MANSFTTNLNLEKPEVGADSNLWGGHLNSDLDILDSIFTSATTRPQSTIIKSDTKIVDATTTTRGILFSLSSISNGTTRTLTAQNTSGTIALTSNIATATTGMATTGAVAAATIGMVTTTGSQTLTNKVINSSFLGTSTATTQTQGNNTTAPATTAYVDRVAVQQYVTTTSNTVLANSTTIPYDDTIPQSSEGSQYLSVTITPKSTTSKLIISAEFNCTISDVSQFAVVALFQDADANALKAVGSGFVASGGNVSMETVSIFHEMVSATTAATTFKLRAGTGGGAQLTMNGAGGSRQFGGACISRLDVMEIGI